MLNFIYFKIPFNSTAHFSTLKVHSDVRVNHFLSSKSLNIFRSFHLKCAQQTALLT